MLALSLPKPAVPFYSVRATLDGADFYLDFEWSMRFGWFMGMRDATGSTIFSPRRLVVNRDLLKGQTDARKPPGALLLVDSTGLRKEPGYEDLDVRHFLVYYLEEELA